MASQAMENQGECMYPWAKQEWKEQVLQKLDLYYAETKKEEINEKRECWVAEANIIKINEIHEEEKKIKLDTW